MNQSYLIATWRGYPVRILNTMQTEHHLLAYIFPLKRSDYRFFRSGRKREAGLARWVPYNELTVEEQHATD